MSRIESAAAPRGAGVGAVLILAALVTAMLIAAPRAAEAASAATLTAEARTALASLRRGNPVADKLAGSAKAILVFPSILKAGFMFGGQLGEGVLLEKGRPTAYYNSIAASYGLQAGIQQFGYALIFLDDASLAEFKASSGFEVGVGPSVVIVDEGVGRTLSTTTVKKGIYAFIFDQSGLMAGLGIQGTKITRISK